MTATQAETRLFEPPKWLWSVWLVLGVLTTAAGVWLLFSRGSRIMLLLILLSASLLFNGISELAQAGARRKPVWGYVEGGLFLLGGLLVLVYPRGSLFALAVALGVVLLVTGVFQAAASIAEREILVHWQLLTALGVLTALAGVVAIVWPGITVLVLALILGIRVTLFGLLQIAAALTLRNLSR
jgi:uncharacterized membrane protein HdeD (DUF308 family)